MTSKLKITNIRGKVLKLDISEIEEFEPDRLREDDWSVERDIKQLIEPVKFVLSPFLLPQGQADMIAELTFANRSDKPIKIDHVDIQIRNGDANSDLDPAESRFADQNYLPWENISDSNWTSIYENEHDSEEIFISESQFFSKKNIPDNNKSFSYQLGSDDTAQRIVTTPVNFHSSDPRSINNYSEFQLSEFTTLSGNDIILLPNDLIEGALPEQEQFGDVTETVDCINFWIEWEDDRLTSHKSTGEFTLGFDSESKIGKYTHVYLFFNLPKSGTLTGNQSNPKITNFPESAERHVFKEWKEEYGIKPTKSDGFELTEPQRVTRAKIKDIERVTVAADYDVPDIKSLDKAVNWVTQSILILIATGSIAIYGNNQSTQWLIITIFVVALVLSLGYIIQLQNFNPITILYFKIRG